MKFRKQQPPLDVSDESWHGLLSPCTQAWKEILLMENNIFQFGCCPQRSWETICYNFCLCEKFMGITSYSKYFQYLYGVIYFDMAHNYKKLIDANKKLIAAKAMFL